MEEHGKKYAAKIWDVKRIKLAKMESIAVSHDIYRRFTIQKIPKLGFVAFVILPDKFAVVHAPVIGVAHVVVGSGVLGVQVLAVEIIFYFYWGEQKR